MTSARTRPLIAVARVAAFIAVMTLLYIVAVLTPVGQAVDDHVYPLPDGIDGLAANVFDTIRSTIPVLITAVAVIVGVWSLLRRQWREPLTASIALVVVSVVAQVLRDDVFPRPDWGMDGLFQDVGNTYPSRHVAYTLVAVIVVLRMVPRRTALLRVTGTIVVMAVAIISVAAYAHRWSDVVGGALLAGAVGCCLSRGATVSRGDLLGRGVVGRSVVAGALAAVLIVAALAAAAPGEATTLAALTVTTAAVVAAIAWVSLIIGSADLDRGDGPK